MLMQKATNNSIEMAVRSHLAWNPAISSKEIGIAVDGGVVSLTGRVPTYAEKIAAERAAQAVYGVTGVANDLDVQLVRGLSDTDLAKEAVRSLAQRVDVPDDKIKVAVKDGWITLSGSVDFGFQRKAAESALKYQTGVRGVTNDISVKAKASPHDVGTRIEEALRRSAEVDARRVVVETKDGTVTLRGNVRSWPEKREAEWAAWGSPGVSQVRNQINIVP